MFLLGAFGIFSSSNHQRHLVEVAKMSQPKVCKVCVCVMKMSMKKIRITVIYIYSWYILYMYYIYTYIYNIYIYICSPCDEILLVVVKHILEMIPLNCGDASKVCDECPA